LRIVEKEAVAEQSHQAHRSVLVGDAVDLADPKRAARRDRLIILKLDQALRAFQYAQGGRVPPPDQM
jgi:hypothetical protein